MRPIAIEHELAALAAGRLAVGSYAVIALPDERAGSVLVPVFESTVEPAVIASVRASYQAKAVGVRRLQPPQTIKNFPRSPLGKLLRAELMRLAAEALGPREF